MGIIFGALLGFWLIDLAFLVVILLRLLLWSRGSFGFAIVLLYCLSVISVCDDVEEEK